MWAADSVFQVSISAVYWKQRIKEPYEKMQIVLFFCFFKGLEQKLDKPVSNHWIDIMCYVISS